MSTRDSSVCMKSFGIIDLTLLRARQHVAADRARTGRTIHTAGNTSIIGNRAARAEGRNDRSDRRLGMTSVTAGAVNRASFGLDLRRDGGHVRAAGELRLQDRP